MSSKDLNSKQRFLDILNWMPIGQKALDAPQADLRKRMKTDEDSEAREELGHVGSCRGALEDFAILSMGAVFEELLNTWLIQRLRWVGASTEDDSEIRQGLLRRIQSWSIAEKIDALQPILQEQTKDLQELRKWRNWVAHDKKSPRPTAIDVDSAVTLLEAVMTKLPLCPHDRMEPLI